MSEKRAWHWVDWLLLAVFTLWFIMTGIFLYTRLGHGNVSRFLGFLAATAAAYALTLRFWRPGYVHRLGFPAAALLAIGTLELSVSAVLQRPAGFLVLPALLIGYVAHPRTIWWMLPLVLFLPPLLEMILIPNLTYRELLGTVTDTALMCGIGYSLQRIVTSNQRMKTLLEENERQYRLIQEQNLALEQYASQIEQLTLLEERNRMARELHDTVGHTFTSAIMGMDAVSYLIQASPEKAQAKLDVLRQMMRQGLEEVRQSIHQIAPPVDDEPLSRQLARLAGEFSLHTGTRVHLDVSGEETDISRQVRLTLIRCLQESLTNAKRHGQAGIIRAWLRFGKHEVELGIEDNGVGREVLEEGFGLRAMKDRVVSLQGTLEVRSYPGRGTTVACRIPVRRTSGGKSSFRGPAAEGAAGTEPAGKEQKNGTR
jgi:signal transduction histidine kinase